MNDRVPSIGFINTQSSFRPYILLSKGNPTPELQKTIRISKPPYEPSTLSSCLHRRPSPYDRTNKDELNKPIKITKSTVTTVEINKPKGFLENVLVEKALAIANGENSWRENEEDTPLTVDIKIKDEKENETKKN